MQIYQDIPGEKLIRSCEETREVIFINLTGIMNVYTKERNWAKLKFIYTIQKYLNGNFGCKFSAFC